MDGPVRAQGWRLTVTVLAILLLVWTPGCASDDGDDLGVLGPGERLPSGMTLTSTAFEDGDPIPERYSCEGDNVPPPLEWEGAPDGAAELALVIEDPDAPDGVFVHWLVVGIQPGTTEAGPAGPPGGGQVLPGSSDNPTYIGPCPPDGDGPHRYVFQVYALDRRPDMDASATPNEKVRAVRAAATAGGVLLGTFER
ncbi:MAG: YbhB/YbcL family Raf kinase inhibitor-like protein [Acidimicrobiales bacterium]